MREEWKSSFQKLLSLHKALEAWPFKDGGWCLSVSPKASTDMDKVCFDFYQKGNNATQFQFYMDGIEFLDLMDNLKKCHYVLPKKVEYVTGDNGCKHLSLEKGEKALVVVHGSDTEKKLNATVGLNYKQVMMMLRIWDLYYSREFDELWMKEYLEGVENSRKYNRESA